jgi:hypothetical protein
MHPYAAYLISGISDAGVVHELQSKPLENDSKIF